MFRTSHHLFTLIPSSNVALPQWKLMSHFVQNTIFFFLRVSSVHQHARSEAWLFSDKIVPRLFLCLGCIYIKCSSNAFQRRCRNQIVLAHSFTVVSAWLAEVRGNNQGVCRGSSSISNSEQSKEIWPTNKQKFSNLSSNTMSWKAAGLSYVSRSN